MKKLELLQILQEKVNTCTKCSGLSGRIQAVFADGNINSKVMVIAEAPGKNEDEKGIPLVGKAGQLLNNALQAVGLERNDLYIANILKCRPPNNRTPTPEECQNCEPFLRNQIKIVNPEYILCLGGIAATNILKTKATIGSLRGKWYDYKDGHVNARVLPTYHPAYLFRNPSEKGVFQDDLRMLLHELVKIPEMS